MTNPIVLGKNEYLYFDTNNNLQKKTLTTAQRFSRLLGGHSSTHLATLYAKAVETNKVAELNAYTKNSATIENKVKSNARVISSMHRKVFDSMPRLQMQPPTPNAKKYLSEDVKTPLQGQSLDEAAKTLFSNSNIRFNPKPNCGVFGQAGMFGDGYVNGQFVELDKTQVKIGKEIPKYYKESELKTYIDGDYKGEAPAAIPESTPEQKKAFTEKAKHIETLKRTQPQNQQAIKEKEKELLTLNMDIESFNWLSKEIDTLTGKTSSEAQAELAEKKASLKSLGLIQVKHKEYFVNGQKHISQLAPLAQPLPYKVIDFATRPSATGNYKLDPETGLPLNPYQQQAGEELKQPLSLGQFGAQQAADPIVLRLNEQSKNVEIVLVHRTDGKGAAIPGGIVDKGELPLNACRRELKEEATDHPERKWTLKFLEATALSRFNFIKDVWIPNWGDYRNTENSWMETTSFGNVLPRWAAKRLRLYAGDDANHAKWEAIKPETIEKWAKTPLFANHSALICSMLFNPKIHAKLEKQTRGDAVAAWNFFQVMQTAREHADALFLKPIQK